VGGERVELPASSV